MKLLQALFNLVLPRSVSTSLTGLGVLSTVACSVTSPPTSHTPLSPAGQAEEPSITATPALAGPNNPLAAPEPRPEHALAKVPVSIADPQWGSADAPVTIVEISDFQCPFCSRVQPTLEQLKTKYGPGKLRIVWKHNPLPFHQDARPTHDTAAAVFMLGGNQAFWRFHDQAFSHQSELTPQNVEAWANQTGVTSPSLFGWLQAGKPAAKVQEDMELAKAIGATGTPAFRINGVTLSGAQPLDKFVTIVDDQLAAAKLLTQSGVPPRLVYSTLTDKNFQAPPPARDDDEEPDTTVWNVPITPDDPVRGSADALVTIVQFSDFQCPFCKRVEDTIDEVRAAYGKEVRVVWKDNPLPFHPRALPAAALAHAVFKKQGNEAFWRLHDAIFDSQPHLDDSDLQSIAHKLGLPWAPLERVLASDKAPPKIEESMDLASDFQARGTPHFFINGRRLSGAQPLGAFKQIIDSELAKAKSLVDAGIPRRQVYAKLMTDAQNAPSPETKQVPLRADAATKGPAKAPVVIQVFSDFQCPFCKHVEPTLAQLDKDFKGSIRFVWRHLPLPFHEHAQLAAEASEEVLAQKGSAAFWAYHDALFEAQSEAEGLQRDNLVRLALAQGVDARRFEAALDQHVHEAKVKADAELASQVGINGTPSFAINDYFIAGAQPLTAFTKLVRLALKQRKP